MAQQAKVDPRIQIAEQPVLEVIMPWLRVLLGEVEVLEQRSEDVLKESTVTFRVQVDARKLESRLLGQMRDSSRRASARSTMGE